MSEFSKPEYAGMTNKAFLLTISALAQNNQSIIRLIFDGFSRKC
jgi:hypothetical protein